MNNSSIKSDPEIARAWQQRSRDRAREKQTAGTPLRRTVSPKQRVALRKVSARQKVRNQEYSSRRLAFLVANPFCMRCVSRGEGTRVATDIHHAFGREGERLNDESGWRGLCRACHSYVHEHPAEAKAEGWSASRIAVSNEEFFADE